jgi:hypothetical protein
MTEAKSKVLEEAFRDAEASLLMEGLDPTTDSRYLAIKARVTAGEMTFDEATSAFTEQFMESIRSRSGQAIVA